MRFFQQLIFILIVSTVLSLWLPWWSIAIAGFLGGVIFHSGKNFLAGFLAIIILWGSMIGWTEWHAASDLTTRVAQIFSLNKPLLIVVTLLIGGIGSGLAALTGSYIRPKKKKNLYY